MTRAAITRWLLYTHRWLGLICCVVFAMWFASGIVMMYARMPRLTAEERLYRLAPLVTDAVSITPHEAVRRASADATRPVERIRLAMLGGRPLYRLVHGARWQGVWADSGARIGAPTPAQVLQWVASFVPEHAATLAYDGRLDDSDQWTLSSVIRAQMPLHRVRLGDRAGTHLYLADASGEVVMKTDRSGRFWGYLGAVLHWVYFTPFRRHDDAWNAFIVYGSLVGCAMCLSGLAAGVWRWSLRPRYRLRGAAAPARSPYAGMMRWHHYGGLIFGLVTFTWILSGLLSMNPWGWSPGRSPSAEERQVLSGGGLMLDSIGVADLRRSTAALAAALPVKEVEWLRYADGAYLTAYRPPASWDVGAWSNTDLAAFLSPQTALDRRTVRADGGGQVFVEFSRSDIEQRLRQAVAAPVADVAWLTDYDDYYYDRHDGRPLPVLRVRFDDPARTWLYADPRSGAVVMRLQWRSRLERWLYNGLHSLDLPLLHRRRPLWDIVVVLLSLGGLLVSVTGVLLGWRRGQRWFRRGTSDRSLAAVRPARPTAG